MRRAIYPGTFDPITYGHLDVLERATHLFDEVVVAVAPNDAKNPIFTQSERLALVKEMIVGMEAVSVQLLEGLTVDFARQLGAVALVRGLRAISDFEYEFQMAQMNRHLADDIETIFLMPNQEYFYTSSNIVKAVANFDVVRVANFVPPRVLEALREKFPAQA
ncbi:pantetheine-phosphate adenylyltransferase [Cerasicoccus arenae]|uniref:Phosphopantetheine adenylyltransferase n=1 Tax=Cerasicoccus arenae TaxID=424488 RepID=A0A8J3GDQ3_9BACT|nr:pantetheine-phosphate adenylyltransferase [Cerasicoccus arenae]MBK1858924.1 pantetheine-phosphate adenylyltransferase [Cerasicoccus arenae]GHC08232.1 phosphopantetheine adenylyltransferase [Cerasicoccus arenae]